MASENRITARYRQRNSDAEFEGAKVERLGPMGIELLVTRKSSALKVADRLDVQVLSDGEVSDFEGYVIGCKPADDEISSSRIAIKFLIESPTHPDRRQNIRWLCPSYFLPQAIAPTPGQFNDFTSFQIRNISKDGLELRTSSENQYLVRGMLLRLSVSLPLIGDASAVVKVLRVEAVATARSEALRIGAEFVEVNQQSRDLLTQYLLQFSNLDSPGNMRRVPDAQSSKKSSLGHITFLRSAREYESLTELREVSMSDLTTDPFDDLYSRLVILSLDASVKASIRVNFPDTRHDTLQKDLIWSTSLPRKDQIVEITDFVSSGSATDGELLVRLLGYVSTACLSGQRPFLVCRLGSDFEPILLKCGFEYVDFKQSKFGAFIGHPIRSAVEKGANPRYWNLIWGDAASYLVHSGAENPKGISRVMVNIYLLLGRFLAR